MMRRVILVLFLFLIASQPSQASQGQDSEESLTLPAVQWNASADIGFISTAPLVTEGLVIAIEPMVNMGSHEVYVEDDGWTVCTKDNKPSAHFEHTVAVTEKGVEILTI